MAQYSLSLLFLVLFLFQPQISFQQQQQISTDDLAVLRAIRTSLTDLPGSNFFSSWNFTSPDPCSTFAGVVCSDDPSSTTPPLLRVTSLTLGTGLADSPGLSGSLSPSISNLSALTQLVLYTGIVTGPIPTQLGNLVNLRVISLTNNHLTGPIPYTISHLTNLHTLDLSGNQLTGSIPPGLTSLTTLKVLILASNRLSGELPNVSTQLLHLDLKQNSFSGKLPAVMPLSLRYFSVSENSIWGPLNGLISLSELVYLDLSMNRFSGTIPESLFHYRLSSMLLQRNNLSGGIPRSVAVDVASYGEGSIVDLSHNFVSGELSPLLAGVENLYLNNNHLIGTIPKEYVSSVFRGSTKTLYLQHNYLSGFPLEPGSVLPDSVSLCLSYNCMVPPTGLTGCPASTGGQLSRPVYQCSVFNNGTKM